MDNLCINKCMVATYKIYGRRKYIDKTSELLYGLMNESFELKSQTAVYFDFFTQQTANSRIRYFIYYLCLIVLGSELQNEI